jgi:hypothetical protein
MAIYAYTHYYLMSLNSDYRRKIFIIQYYNNIQIYIFLAWLCTFLWGKGQFLR